MGAIIRVIGGALMLMGGDYGLVHKASITGVLIALGLMVAGLLVANYGAGLDQSKSGKRSLPRDSEE
jgi:hypothetical protein